MINIDSSYFKPPKFLTAFLLIVDIQMLLYWFSSLVRLLWPSTLPNENLYNDYYNPIMIAWNWSFFPMDMVLSITGLWSVYLLRRKNQNWRLLAVFSLALTFCAGLMAVSFWAIRLEFDLVWWGFNLAYILGAIWFIPQLMAKENNLPIKN
ncbi:MAG: DUF5360 family protein [Cellvibrionaceae bacterium]